MRKAFQIIEWRDNQQGMMKKEDVMDDFMRQFSMNNWMRSHHLKAKGHHGNTHGGRLRSMHVPVYLVKLVYHDC